MQESHRRGAYGQCVFDRSMNRQVIKAWQNSLPASKQALRKRSTRSLGRGPSSTVLREIEASTVDYMQEDRDDLVRERRGVLSASFSVREEKPSTLGDEESEPNNNWDEPVTILSPDDNITEFIMEDDAVNDFEEADDCSVSPHSGASDHIDLDNIFGYTATSSKNPLTNGMNAIIFGESEGEGVEPPDGIHTDSYVIFGDDESSVDCSVSSQLYEGVNKGASIDLGDSWRIRPRVIDGDVPLLERSPVSTQIGTINEPTYADYADIAPTTHTHHNDNVDLETSKQVNSNHQKEDNLMSDPNVPMQEMSNSSPPPDDQTLAPSSQVDNDQRVPQEMARANIDGTDRSVTEMNDGEGSESEAVQSYCFDLQTQDSSSSSSEDSDSDSDSDTIEFQITNENAETDQAAAEGSNCIHDILESDEGTKTVTLGLGNSQSSAAMDSRSPQRLDTPGSEGRPSGLQETDEGIEKDASRLSNCKSSAAIMESRSTSTQILQTPGSVGRPSRLKLRPKDKSAEVESSTLSDTESIEEDDTPMLNRSRVRKATVDPFLSQFPRENSAEVGSSALSDTPILNRSRGKKKAATNPFLSQFPSPSVDDIIQNSSTPYKKKSSFHELNDTPSNEHRVVEGKQKSGYDGLEDTPPTLSFKRAVAETISTQDKKKDKQSKVEKLAKRRKIGNDILKFLDVEAEAGTDDSGDDEDEDEAELSQDSFINDSSQLEYTQDILDAFDADRSQRSDPADACALHRQVDMMKEQDDAFGTPMLNRNRNRDSQLSIPSSEKHLGKMHFIRSIIEHHRQGGGANDLEREYHTIMRENGTSASQDSSSRGSTQHSTPGPPPNNENSLAAHRPPSVPTPKKPTLTAEQLERIERNRKNAFLLRQKMMKK